MIHILTVGDLKKYLSGFEDDDKIEIAVGSYYKAFPISYLQAFSFNSFRSEIIGGKKIKGTVRISCSLPEQFRVVTLKKNLK